MLQSVDIGLVILRIAERQVVLHAGKILVPATAVGEIDRALTIAVGFDLFGQRTAQNAMIGLVILTQGCGVDCGELREPDLRLCHTLIFGFETGIADPP